MIIEYNLIFAFIKVSIDLAKVPRIWRESAAMAPPNGEYCNTVYGIIVSMGVVSLNIY